MHLTITRARGLELLVVSLVLSACGSFEELGQQDYELASKCTIVVEGKGTKQLEDDYLPHVITCENGAADFEALKAQAVAARSYAYYVTRNGGSVKDGQSNQVYTCSAKPQQKHYDAVKATAGQVLRYQQTVICSFFVAGAKPSDAVGCVAKSGDPDGTNTEKYVTYNLGKSGGGIKQSTLGWVSSTNIYNRGCQSQNGANCLSKAGRDYKHILRFYYGDDIELYQTTGSCVTVPPKPDQGVPPPPPPDHGVPPKPDQGVPPQPDTGTPPPTADSGSSPSYLDSGSPTLDQGGTPASSLQRSQLSGGCAVAAATPSRQLAFSLALLLLFVALRRRRR